jgi:hypothetical protein
MIGPPETAPLPLWRKDGNLEVSNGNAFSAVTESRQGLTRKDFLLKGATILGVGGVVALRSEPASAIWYKTVTTTPVRNGPSIRSTVVATLGSNVAVDVGSQTGGSRIGSGSYPNNSTWNRLTDGRWIHDIHLNTKGDGSKVSIADGLGGYALYSIGIPRTTPTVLGRSTRDAVAWWAETQLGVTAYDGWCQGFGRSAWLFGGAHDIGSYGTAANCWATCPTGAGKSTTGTPPRGALVFWDWSTYGHAAVSAGNGYVVSSYYGATTRSISWATIKQVTDKTGRYRGWWLPK